MKNLTSAIFILASILSGNALAKTQGSYLGVDLLNTKVKFHQRYTNNKTPQMTDRKPSFSSSDYGAGFHYIYAANLGGLFVAPGLILELNNATTHANGEGSRQKLQRVEIQSRYGAKIDLGFDMTSVISPYVTGAYVAVRHKTREYFNDYSNSRIRSGTAMDWIYGGGIRFNCDKFTSVNVEYTTQKIDLRNTTDGTTDRLVSRYRTRVDVLKFGISYRF
jgi:opacity protein-like surface antigen